MKFSAFAFAFFWFSCCVIAQEVDDERAFSYDMTSEMGPLNWGRIQPEWRECGSGELQSPIDLIGSRVDNVTIPMWINRDYRPSNATLINRGHDMMVRWIGDAGHVHINGTEFHLRQCHWHSPSEHTINGNRFDLEAHLVHQDDNNRIAVIGILYNIGEKSDPFLSMMKHDLEEMRNTMNLERYMEIVNPHSIRFESRGYYRYIGSLTIPPCTQNIIWTISRRVRSVTMDQVRLIRDAVHDESGINARPIQPIHDRRIQLHP